MTSVASRIGGNFYGIKIGRVSGAHLVRRDERRSSRFGSRLASPLFRQLIGLVGDSILLLLVLLLDLRQHHATNTNAGDDEGSV